MAVLTNSIFESSLELCSFKLTFWKAFSANPIIIYEKIYSRMEQVKFVEDRL